MDFHITATARRRGALLGAGALLATLGLPPLAAAQQASRDAMAVAAPTPQPRAARAADDESGKAARSALADASSGKRAAQKLDGAAKSEALAAVAADYVRIADNEAFPPAGRAEAAFRAGDILRGLKRLADAEAQFNRAVALGEPDEEGREFAARSLLELAHIKRRAKDVPAALDLYAQVGGRFADQRRSAAHAATWTGKLLLKSGEREKAAAALMGYSANWPEYPTEAVRNADLVAVDQVEAGDEAAAQITVNTIRAVMESVIAKGGQQAEAVQKALDGMRATELLAGY
jgi:tetratricopeptide (TPR) repeat protein